MFTFGYDVIELMILAIIILNACALAKFIRVVKFDALQK